MLSTACAGSCSHRCRSVATWQPGATAALSLLRTAAHAASPCPAPALSLPLPRCPCRDLGMSNPRNKNPNKLGPDEVPPHKRKRAKRSASPEPPATSQRPAAGRQANSANNKNKKKKTKKN